MPKLVDFTGYRFGRLTVICRDANDKFNRVTWKCLCNCGKTKVVSGNALQRGSTSSCGCGWYELHGGSGSRLHRIWKNMKNRCRNPNSQDWPLYGGRGIRVCDDWNGSFSKFRDWALASGYSDTLSIDRINDQGDYEPINCRWATSVQQAKNRRKRKDSRSRYRGVTQVSPGKWTARINIEGKRYCLGTFMREEDAAAAYDNAARQRSDGFQRFNFSRETLDAHSTADCATKTASA